MSINKKHPDCEIQKYNYPLEGLRGLCALVVGFSHVFSGTTNLLDTKGSLWLASFNFAHVAVLIFFVLSGYVIGINYPDERFNVKGYLKKRFIRIYPIYLSVILFCWILEPNFSFEKLISSLFILPGLKAGLVSNVVLWSIHYEVLFYLFFTIQIRSKKGIFFSIILFALVAFFTTVIESLPGILSGYSAGYCFWLSGLLLSRLKLTEQSTKQSFLSIIFLLIAYNELAIGKILLNGFGLTHSHFNIVSVADLIALPICFLIIQLFSGRYVIYQRLLLLIVFTLPIVTLGYLIFLNRVLENIHWITALITTILGVLMLVKKQDLKIFNRLAFFGSISYTFYIIHYPIAYALKGIMDSSVFALILWIILSLGASYIIEIKIFRGLKLIFQK